MVGAYWPWYGTDFKKRHICYGFAPNNWQIPISCIRQSFNSEEVTLFQGRKYQELYIKPYVVGTH